MQNMLQFVNEHRQRILRISYFVLILPTFLVTIIPLLSPMFLQLPNADVVQVHFSRPASMMDVGYYSICLNYYDRPFEDRNRYIAYEACISTTHRHTNGEKLAREWGKLAVAEPEVYQKFADNFSVALNIQRQACYPGLLIAAAVLWILSVGFFATAAFVQGSATKVWISRLCKGFAVIASVLIVVASVATTAGAYAVVQFSELATSWRICGRMGAILAVQWAAAVAMSVHAMLTLVVAIGGKDDSKGLIRLEG